MDNARDKKIKIPQLRPNTAYMLRQDGALLRCGSSHPYIKDSSSWDFKKNLNYLITESPQSLSWFQNNTTNNELRQLLDKNIPLGLEMTEGDYNRMVDLSNEEFCRVRTSNYKYDYGGNNGEVYFRISSKDFNWFDDIWDVVMFNSKNEFVKFITVIKDYQIFGGKIFDYFNSKLGDINKMSVDDFLTLDGFIGDKMKEDLSTSDNKINQIEDFVNALYKLRQDSIVNEGEYGLGNLVFKEMRNLGYLDNIKDIKTKIEDKDLSLEGLNNGLHPIPQNSKILKLKGFIKKADELKLTDADIKDLIDQMKSRIPEASLGSQVYKFRWSPSKWSTGSRDGARVIYVEFIKDEDSSTVYLVTIYRKSEKTDLDPKELDNIKTWSKYLKGLK